MFAFSRLVLGFTVCGVAAVATAGEIRVCESSVAPFLSTKNGVTTGIEYDILKGFALQQGLRLRMITVNFGDLIAKLQQGECDLGAARMTRTEDREKFVYFSAAYFPVRVALIQRRGEAVADIKELAGKKVLVIGKSSLESAVRTIPGAVLVNETPGKEGVAQLLAGEIDVFPSDSTAVNEVLANNPGVQLALFLPGENYYAFPMPKGSALKKDLDDYINAIKKSSYLRILRI